jgi:type II secretory pathway component PulF
MTRAGETGGVLDSALLRVADQLEKEEALRRQVKSAMAYPGVVIGFSLIVLIGLVTFLVPSSSASSSSSAASCRSSRRSPCSSARR